MTNDALTIIANSVLASEDPALLNVHACFDRLIARIAAGVPEELCKSLRKAEYRLSDADDDLAKVARKISGVAEDAARAVREGTHVWESVGFEVEYAKAVLTRRLRAEALHELEHELHHALDALNASEVA